MPRMPYTHNTTISLLLHLKKTYTHMQQSMPYSDSENKSPKRKRKNQMYLNDKQPSSLKF